MENTLKPGHSVWDQEHWVTPWAPSRPKERSFAYTKGVVARMHPGDNKALHPQPFMAASQPCLGWVTAPGTFPEPEPVLGMPGLSMLLDRGQCPSSWKRFPYISYQVHSRSRDSLSCSFYNRTCSVWHCNETVLKIRKFYTCNILHWKCSITQLILTRMRIINFTSKK